VIRGPRFGGRLDFAPCYFALNSVAAAKLLALKGKAMNCASSSTAAQHVALCTFQGLVFLVLLLLDPDLSSAQGTGSVDEPTAHELYDQMNAVMRNAETLSFMCRFHKEALGIGETSCTYRVWLKKPNLVRMETESDAGEQGGVLIGDGTHLWIYWPTGRPRFDLIDESAAAEATRTTSYMKMPAVDATTVSIWHKAPLLGAGMAFPVLNVSTFHGHVDSLSDRIDGVRGLGNEIMDGHPCTKVEVSMFDHQRSFYLWLSKQDHLPRKLVEIVRVEHEVITHETWSSVKINNDIPDSMFRWSPPADWQQWKLPEDEDNWPRVGSEAPDFDLSSVGGDRIRLSDYRGKPVWLNFWRIGCPSCVDETPFLQEIHTKYRDSGLVLIGVNVLDDRMLLRKFLDKMGVTYLNVLDTSDTAKRVYDEDYGVGGIPTNCLIDADGIVVDVWVGYSEERTARALRKVGIEMEP
jgi:peroxiredoxin/outer membrane lipoprotein-sorting protein